MYVLLVGGGDVPLYDVKFSSVRLSRHMNGSRGNQKAELSLTLTKSPVASKTITAQGILLKMGNAAFLLQHHNTGCEHSLTVPTLRLEACVTSGNENEIIYIYSSIEKEELEWRWAAEQHCRGSKKVCRQKQPCIGSAN